jgi:2-aminoethylphosphonate-pyruvate transaminase
VFSGSSETVLRADRSSFSLTGDELSASETADFTSPTHVVRAFKQALTELIEEGGVEARYQRYCENHRILVEGMRALGFKTLLEDDIQSPIITSFLYPHEGFDFKTFYYALKNKGFVIYPGKISKADTFRIGNIGDVHPEDFRRLVEVIRETKY